MGEEEDEELPNVPAEVTQYIQKLLTIANETAMFKGATFVLHPNINALCQRTANEVHRDVLPGDSHVTAMGAIKDEFGLETSATTAPGLLKVSMLTAVACQKVRMQRRLLGNGTVQAQKKPRKR